MSTGYWEWRSKSPGGKFIEFITELPYVVRFYPRTYDMSARPDVLLLRQVHSSKILGPEKIDTMLLKDRPEGDGWFVNKPNIEVGVLVADCLPVAVLSASGKGFFLLHCGWRSIRDGIIQNALNIAKEAHISPNDLHVVVGPCIRGCHYEVGQEFKQIFPDHVVHRRDRLYLDLFSILLSILKQSGVPKSHIAEPPYCTFEHQVLFWSYRRDGNNKKSMLMTTQMTV